MFGKKGANHYTSRNVTMRAGVCFAFYQETIGHVFSREEVLSGSFGSIKRCLSSSNCLKEYMVHSETISKELLFTPCTVQEVQAFLDAVQTFPNKQPEQEAAAGGSSRRNTAPLHLLLCTDPTCRARAAT
eukprot:3747002-Rhodomonas_salina.1